MKRQEKFPETATFHYYNANPHNRITTDCAIRAESVALEIPYNQVIMETAQLQCDTGFDVSSTMGIAKYMECKGWKKNAQPRKSERTLFGINGRTFGGNCRP